ncbi:MAG: TlpA family protein disulfide reductase [Candidatus Eremiobacteraeota bacterium]|nr:TlpA family protein disulfide reductase [Candidatus Eremiobacteraeota bacterium]
MNRKGTLSSLMLCAFVMLVLVAGSGMHKACALGQAEARQKLFPRYEGKVLVLLLGMEGCSETGKATQSLAEYSKEKPREAVIIRVDVPPPEKLPGMAASAAKWNAPFSRIDDNDRKIARALDFFSYPTLYILDGKREIRFSGGCDAGEVKRMVAEILSEKQGDAPHVYTRPLPEKGTLIADFDASTLEKKPVKLYELLGKKGTVIFFGSPSCPFSASATSSLPEIQREFGKKGIAFLIIDSSRDSSPLSFYREKAPGIPVLADGKGALSGEKFGVQAVPFFYVLDTGAHVAERKPFTREGAEAALRSLLGEKVKSAPAVDGAG